jgi:hypothetical protein
VAVRVPAPKTVDDNPVVVVRSKSETAAPVTKLTGSMEVLLPVALFSVTAGFVNVAVSVGTSFTAVMVVPRATVAELYAVDPP